MAAYALPGIFVMGCLVCLMESYVIRCPEQSEWNIRAEIQCQNITKYFCLYNYIHYTYEEGCTGPEWDIPGSKRVYSSNFNTVTCRDTRYQPIRFVTNGNSDCIFRKSLCTEEGQTLFSNGTTRTDSTCRCDYTKGYAFVTVPRSKCYCQPSEEDCSCYLKKCQGIGYNLSPDYECTKDITNNTDCPSMSANPYEDPHINMKPTGTLREDAIRGKWVVFIVVLCALIGMIVSTVITMRIMLRQRLPRNPRISTEQTGNAESKRMDTGLSLDTIERNGSKHESAWKNEIKWPERGPSLQLTDQNVINAQSAGNAESKRMDTGLSLDTIEQNGSKHESGYDAAETCRNATEFDLRVKDGINDKIKSKKPPSRIPVRMTVDTKQQSQKDYCQRRNGYDAAETCRNATEFDLRVKDGINDKIKSKKPPSRIPVRVTVDTKQQRQKDDCQRRNGYDAAETCRNATEFDSSPYSP